MSDSPNKIQIIDGKLVEVIRQAIPVAEASILSNWPWLNVPIVRQLWEGLLNWIVGEIASAAGTLTGYVVLDSDKYRELSDAKASLLALNAAKAKGDAEAVEAASADLDSKVDPLLHYVGQVNP